MTSAFDDDSDIVLPSFFVSISFLILLSNVDHLYEKCSPKSTPAFTSSGVVALTTYAGYPLVLQGAAGSGKHVQLAQLANIIETGSRLCQSYVFHSSGSFLHSSSL